MARHTHNQASRSDLFLGQIIGITQDQIPVFQFLTAEQSAFGLRFGSLEPGSLFTPNAQINGQAVGSVLAFQSGSQNAHHNILDIHDPLPAIRSQSLAPLTHWPAFNDFSQTLSQSSQTVAQSGNTIIPNPAQAGQFMASVMFFVAALRSGDMGLFLKQQIGSVTKSTSSSVLSDIQNETNNAVKASEQAASKSSWHNAMIPIAMGDIIAKVGFWHRDESPYMEDDTDHSATRFVFDMAFDSMGHVQLDGLVRVSPDQHKTLDIVLRTEKHFSPHMRQIFRQRYNEALQETSLTGDIHFHSQQAAGNKDTSFSSPSKENWSDLV